MTPGSVMVALHCVSNVLDARSILRRKNVKAQNHSYDINNTFLFTNINLLKSKCYNKTES